MPLLLDDHWGGGRQIVAMGIEAQANRGRVRVIEALVGSDVAERSAMKVKKAQKAKDARKVPRELHVVRGGQSTSIGVRSIVA